MALATPWVAVGLVYVFSRESEAKAARKRMAQSPEIKKLLGRHPAGIHVMYFDADTGALELATSLVIWPERWMALSERWMALSERRPLLDVGAKVFYLDGDNQRIPVT